MFGHNAEFVSILKLEARFCDINRTIYQKRRVEGMSNYHATINITLHHDNFSLSCGDLAAQLTPKDFAILQSFKESKSETISRQSLIQSHFPKTNGNGEQLLNNAIYRMRLGLRNVTDLENPIITVHKKGYKLHKAIYLQEDEFAQPNPADTRRLMFTSLTSASLIFGVLVVAVILNVTAQTTPEPLQPESALPLSSTLLLQQRSAPQVSPNGEHLTYVGVDLQGNEHLYQQALQDTGSPLPQRITLSERHSSATSPQPDVPMTAFNTDNAETLNDKQYSAGVWSPDNSHIAFTSRSAQEKCRVKIHSRENNTVLDVAQCSNAEYLPLKNTTDWSPDGKRLYFVSAATAQADQKTATSAASRAQSYIGNRRFQEIDTPNPETKIATNQQHANGQNKGKPSSALAYYDITTQQVVTVDTQLQAGMEIAQPTIINDSQIAFTVTDKKDQMRVAIHDLQSGLTTITPYHFRQIRGMTYLPKRKQVLLSAKTHSQFQMYALQLPTNNLNRLLILSSHDLVDPSVGEKELYFAEEHQIRHNITMSRQGKLHLPFLDMLNTSVNAYTQPLLTNRAVFFTYQLAQQWHLGYVQRNQPEIVTNIATENRIEQVSAAKGFATPPEGNKVVYVNQRSNSREKLTLFDIDSRENKTLLTANNNLWNFHHPFWSQCDNAVLFSAAHSPKDYSYHTSPKQTQSQSHTKKSNATSKAHHEQQAQHKAARLQNNEPASQLNRPMSTLYGWQYQPDTQKLQSILDNPASKMVASEDCRYIVYTNRNSNGIALYDRIQQQTVAQWPYLKKQQYQLISQFNNTLYFVADYQGKHAIYRTKFMPFNPEMLYRLPLPDMIEPHSIQALDNGKVVLSYSTTKSDLQKIMLEDLH